MALPDNTIQKIQTTSGNKDIAPTMMTDSNKQYKAELPTLTHDETIALKSDIDALPRPQVFRFI